MARRQGRQPAAIGTGYRVVYAGASRPARARVLALAAAPRCSRTWTDNGNGGGGGSGTVTPAAVAEIEMTQQEEESMTSLDATEEAHGRSQARRPLERSARGNSSVNVSADRSVSWTNVPPKHSQSGKPAGHGDAGMRNERRTGSSQHHPSHVSDVAVSKHVSARARVDGGQSDRLQWRLSQRVDAP